MAKAVVVLLACFALLLSVSPAQALAHGPVLKGQEVGHNALLASTTGNCSCDNRWYTIGLAPGRVTITAKVQNCESNLIKFCVAQAFLLRNKEQLANANVVCHNLKHCGLSQSMTYRVTKRGAYYLLVQGSGSLVIHYSLRIRGNVYPLHCKKFC